MAQDYEVCLQLLFNEHLKSSRISQMGKQQIDSQLSASMRSVIGRKSSEQFKPQDINDKRPKRLRTITGDNLGLHMSPFEKKVYPEQEERITELEEEIALLKEEMLRLKNLAQNLTLDNNRLMEDNKKKDVRLVQIADTFATPNFSSSQMSPILCSEMELGWSEEKIDSYLQQLQSHFLNTSRDSKIQKKESFVFRKETIQPRMVQVERENQILKENLAQMKTYVQKQFQKMRAIQAMMEQL